VIRRSTRVRGLNAFKAKRPQIEFFDKCVDYSHRVVLGNVVIWTFRQQRDLAPILSFNESLHVWQPALSRCHNLGEHLLAIKALSHSLGRQRKAGQDFAA
jgi:hypothetical protein